MSANVDQNNRPDYDQVLQDIADYVLNYRIDSPAALDTARNCLMDTLGCGLLAPKNGVSTRPRSVLPLSR